jgi:hypothetical protein
MNYEGKWYSNLLGKPEELSFVLRAVPGKAQPHPPNAALKKIGSI